MDRETTEPAPNPADVLPECAHENVTPSWCGFGLCECGERMFRGTRPDMSGPAPWHVANRHPTRATRLKGWFYDVHALERLRVAAEAARDALLAVKRRVDGDPRGISTPRRVCLVCGRDRSAPGPAHEPTCEMERGLEALGNSFVIPGYGHSRGTGGWVMVDTAATPHAVVQEDEA